MVPGIDSFKEWFKGSEEQYANWYMLESGGM